MESLSNIKATLQQRRRYLKEHYAVSYMGIFGSRRRGDDLPDSDLDILVDFDDPPGLLKYIELELFLTDLLGMKVDLVMRSALKPRIGKHILREVVTV